MTDSFDLLLSGGTVIDPASGTEQKLNVAITGHRIAAIGSNIPPVNAKKVLNVDGCIITPGLIDFHVHSYWGVNPYGFNADPICRASGVTTTMDAGSSGPINFLGFRKLVYEQSRTRMLAFVALAQLGELTFRRPRGSGTDGC
jgi:dihydroorotase